MKKSLALMLALIMVLALVPTVAFAETYVAWIDGTGYETLEAAEYRGRQFSGEKNILREHHHGGRQRWLSASHADFRCW